MDLITLYPPILLRRLLQWRFERANPGAPWLTGSAVLLLDGWLKPTDNGWEWGSGRSTSWFAKRVSHLTSVEHDATWHANVSRRLGECGVSGKVDYKLTQCEFGEYDEVARHPYADSILEVPDESLDFVLVDGLLRLTCARNAISKVKRGGILILDNAERYLPDVFLGRKTSLKWGRSAHRDSVWASLDQQLADWRVLQTSDGLSDTRLWVNQGSS